MIYNTKPAFGRFCVPAALNEKFAEYTKAIEGYLEKLDTLSAAMKDIETTRNFILGSAILAMLLGFVWMIVMKMCAGCITWTAVLILLVSMFGISKFLYDSGINT